TAGTHAFTGSRRLLPHSAPALVHSCAMAATAVPLRSRRRPRGRAVARGGGAGTPRVRAHLRPLLPRAPRLLPAHARQPAGGRGRAPAQLRLGLPRAAREPVRRRAAPGAVQDGPQPLTL